GRRSTDGLRVCGGTHRQAGVRGPARGPADLLQPARPRDALNVGPLRFSTQPGSWGGYLGPSEIGARSGTAFPAPEYRLPSRRHGKQEGDPFRCEVALGAAEVVVEGRRASVHGYTQATSLSVDQPTVGRTGRLHDRLGEGRVTMDDERNLG